MLKKRLDELKGKVALITGIGKKRASNHIAHILADYGVNIALHYNLSKKEAKILKSQLMKKGIET
jgi:enoyl-[acyl-carrier-protein] reductase (NADH)